MACNIVRIGNPDENKFLLLEKTILRKIFGSIKDDRIGEWRRRKNRELNKLYNKKNVVEIIKKGKLR